MSIDLLLLCCVYCVLQERALFSSVHTPALSAQHLVVPHLHLLQPTRLLRAVTQ